MASELEKIIVTMEANNAALLKKIDQNTKSLKQFEGRTKQSLGNVDKSFIKTANVAQVSGKRIGRSFKGAAGQLGFQVQDIAVQLQAGQNAMLILGQQGSQIASIFGPGGAVIGAFIAISSAMAGALIPQLLKSKDAADELDKALKKLNETLDKNEQGTFEYTKAFKQLAKENKDIALVRVGREQDRALETAKLAVEALKEELGEISGLNNKFNLPIQDLGELIRLLNKPLTTKEELFKVQGILNNLAIGAKTSSPELRKLADDVNIAAIRVGELDQLIDKLNNTTVATLDFASIADLKKITSERLSLVKKMVSASSMELNAFIKQVQQEAKAEEAFNQSIQSALDQAFPDEAKIRGLREQILTLKVALEEAFAEGRVDDVKKYEKAVAELEKQVNKVGSELTKWQEEALKNLQGSFGDFFEDMDAGFDGLADTLLKMLNRMIADAASAQLMKALFGDDGSGGFLGGAGGTVGTVLNGLLGFDGGGYTGNQPRSGGLDGKGGFLAMMHPQEIVTDLHGSARGSSDTSENPLNVAVVYDTESVLEIMRSPAGRKIVVENSRKDAREINRNLSRI